MHEMKRNDSPTLDHLISSLNYAIQSYAILTISLDSDYSIL